MTLGPTAGEKWVGTQRSVITVPGAQPDAEYYKEKAPVPRVRNLRTVGSMSMPENKKGTKREVVGKCRLWGGPLGTGGKVRT